MCCLADHFQQRYRQVSSFSVLLRLVVLNLSKAYQGYNNDSVTGF